MLLIPVIERLGQKDCEFEASLSFTGRPCLVTNETVGVVQ